MIKVSARPGILAANLALIDSAFTTHLRQRFSRSTIKTTRWATRHAARWLARRGKRLCDLTAREMPTLAQASAVPAWHRLKQKRYRIGLNRWFKFRDPNYRVMALRWGRPKKILPTRPWDRWVRGYLRFLEQHRGLAARTLARHREVAWAFLDTQFGAGRADWQRIDARRIWRFTHAFARDRKARTINHDLTYLRRFFSYLHLRGVGVLSWREAVPRFSGYGESTGPSVLTDAQRRLLLASFDRRSATGSRNYCLTLCLVDLGLRPLEARQLSLSDIDWKRSVLHVPATKTDRGRELPLRPRIGAALRTYIEGHRPATDCERIFVNHVADGNGALSQSNLQQMLKSAYRRCGFPDQWCGGYRLRHTFATRLHARGADLKNIADLLGHRYLQTTTIYAQVDLNGLRALALPWPL